MNYEFGIKNREGGYIALTSVIIVSLLLITVITVLSSTNYFARFNILENEYKQRSSSLAEGCVDYALGKLAANSSYAGNNEVVTIGSNTCQVNSVSPTTSFPKVISTTGSFPQTTPQKSYTNLLVTVNSTFHVTFWQEIP